MFDIQDLYDQLPIDQLAAQVGGDPAEVGKAVGAVLPALLMGMDANAQDASGEASLLDALGQHAGRSPFDVSSVDEADGAKIARHVFGSNEDAVVARLGGAAGDRGLIQKLIPILAPLVMAWLANQVAGQSHPGRRRGCPRPDPRPGAGRPVGDAAGLLEPRRPRRWHPRRRPRRPSRRGPPLS
jgi:hypothetical protein